MKLQDILKEEIDSIGDVILDKPLYELGITGVFTKNLDIALLNKKIDIAVHSMKDVPTVLPKGIIQAAVFKRANYNDILVLKDTEEFFGQPNGVIATGSLRRKAQWLHRYPTHKVEDIRGNVNTRLEKLADSETWNGAIFAAAGLGRLELTPENSVNLEWMVPAPAQGAIMIATLESNMEALDACVSLNHEDTEISTTIERLFLKKLEGGCSAPIGALAYIKEMEIHFHGIILSPDGTKKIEAKRTAKLGEHHSLVDDCVEFILSRGGKSLIGKTVKVEGPTTIFSSKLLSLGQKDIFNNQLNVGSSDFIKITANRIKPVIIKATHQNVVITSKNGVDAILKNCPVEDLDFKTIYCVGRRTKRLIEQRIGPVKYTAKNAKALANHLVEFMDGTEVSYFCSDIRLDDLTVVLEENNIKVQEIEAYSTKLEAPKLNSSIEGVMFYSPSTIKSFLQKNKPECAAYCIGESTATEARKHFKEVLVAKIPTVESVIELVNQNYI